MQVLDAPSLQDDFYLNLVDWSSQNVLAVGLGTCVYLWSASNSKVLSQLYNTRLLLHICTIMILTLMDWMKPPNQPINIQVTKLCDLGPRDSVCAVHWSREGSYLSIGTGLGDVQVCLALLSPLPCRYCNSSQFTYKPSTKWKMLKLCTSGVPLSEDLD
jgi:cell division cycle 20-like protein 1 (cofactor of APC complex)